MILALLVGIVRGMERDETRDGRCEAIGAIAARIVQNLDVDAEGEDFSPGACIRQVDQVANVHAIIVADCWRGHLCSPPAFNGTRHINQQFTESGGRVDAGSAVNAATFTAYLAKFLCAGQANAGNQRGIILRLTFTPLKAWQFAAIGKQQGGLAGIVTEAPLFYAASPTALKVGIDPSAGASGNIQPEVRPCTACPRVFNNATPFANGCKSGFKATAIDDFELHIDGGTVLLISKSGSEDCPARFTRALLRKYVEMGSRLLEAEDALDQLVVVPMRKRD